MTGSRHVGRDALAMSAVVLCGGRSTRFGEDKALVPFEGEPLVLRIGRRMSEVADPVFLASGTAGRLGDALGELAFREIADAEPEQAGGPATGYGPLAGLIAGLEASPHRLVAAVAVDMPFASPAVLRLLAERIGDHDAAVPVTADGTQPLHAVYAREAVPALRAALLERRLAVRDVLRRLHVRSVDPAEWASADPTGRFAWNVNHPDDLFRSDAGDTSPQPRGGSPNL